MLAGYAVGRAAKAARRGLTPASCARPAGERPASAAASPPRARGRRRSSNARRPEAARRRRLDGQRLGAPRPRQRRDARVLRERLVQQVLEMVVMDHQASEEKNTLNMVVQMEVMEEMEVQ